MSDEQVSKRERQKARRAARLEAEQKAAAASRRNRLVAYVVLVALVVGGISFLIYRQIAAGRANQQQAEEVAARLDELGCTEDTRMPDLGGGHIPTDPESLVAEAPEVIYPDQPPTSGRHVGQVAPTGVYDVAIDPRVLTHDLEHGYINIFYAADAPEDQVEELKEWAQGQIDGNRPKMIVAQWYGESLPNEANFTYTAWFFRQSCETFDADVVDVFADSHYGTDGEAPERTGTGTHLPGAQGVVEIVEGEDFLLPPLGNSLFDELPEGATPEAAPDSTETGAPEGTEPESTATPADEPTATLTAVAS